MLGNTHPFDKLHNDGVHGTFNVMMKLGGEGPVVRVVFDVGFRPGSHDDVWAGTVFIKKGRTTITEAANGTNHQLRSGISWVLYYAVVNLRMQHILAPQSFARTHNEIRLETAAPRHENRIVCSKVMRR